MSGHVVLLGDSIFDNGAYVEEGPTVLQQLQQALPTGWTGSMLAADRATVAEVSDQLDRLPAAASFLALSVGGNDALSAGTRLLFATAKDVQDALKLLAEPRDRFEAAYRELVRKIVDLGLPLAICTIYDSYPGVTPADRIGLSAFNDVITRVAFEAGATLVDLRLVCQEPSDYSQVLKIEPSVVGGEKIARAIVRAVLDGGGGARAVI